MIAAGPSVVLVDDAADVRMLVRSALRLSGRYQVVAEGDNGADAVELVRQHKPDVLVLDVSMPVMDGLEALPEVRAASPQTKVVMYTGFDERGLAERATELGAAGYLRKSTSLDRFADELDAVLRSARPDEPVPVPVVEAEPPAPIPGSQLEILDDHLERFREVFEEAAIGMGTMTLTGRLVRANKALARLVGRSVDDLIGLPYFDITHGLSPEALTAALTAHNKGNDVVQLEHDVLVDGARRRVSATIAVARDSRQQPLYLFVQAQDISAQRQAEEALRSSEERFALLVDAVEDYAIFMLDPKGYVISWNPGAQRANGYTADEIIGQHFRVFYPPDKQAINHPEHELQIAIVDGHYEEEGWRVRKDGTMLWANVLISAIRDSAGELVGFAKVTRDVTERRNMLQREEAARQALADANKRLEEANERLARAAKDQAQFVAVTSHELRNPISVLTGASAMLANNWAELTKQERAEMLATITTSSARLNRLLTDLLTSSRLESGAMQLRLQEVEVAPLLEQAKITTLRSFPDAEVSVECPPGLIINADPDRLSQAIENLAVNAVRHGKSPVHLSGRPVERGIEIRVSDAGGGVAPAVLPRLFERFVTGRQPGGTGLGLFIVRELARAHGGDVRYEPGDPTTFVITLPAPRTTAS